MMGLILAIIVLTAGFGILCLMVYGAWVMRPEYPRISTEVVQQGIWAFFIGMALASVLAVSHFFPIAW